jgi:M6 family metalloprotease-like protein
MTQVAGVLSRFPQAEGPDVWLRVHGDEHYARYETPSGYAVVYDVQLGLYAYAVLIGGMFVSSGVSIAVPPPAGLPRGLRESSEVRRTKFGLRYAKLEPPPGAEGGRETFGPEGGLLRGRRVALGRITGLTILVEFQDVRTTITADDVRAMLNADEYQRNGNYCSVRRYFELMSSGKLRYTNEVVGPYTLSRRRNHYEHELLLREALDAVVADKGAAFLARFDSREEGIVDAINVLYAGDVVYEGDLWPHNHYEVIQHGDHQTYFYMLTNLGRAPVDLAIGTICHESGHLLCRWPDLYDYGNRDGDPDESRGLGEYCLMSSGNHRNLRRTPAPVCAYLRNLVGWTRLEDVTGHRGPLELTHGDYGRAFVHRTGRDNEYFLLENRSRIDLDEHQVANGLAIYHCDTLGSNEWQDGRPDRHYQCALLQADGHGSLELDRNNGDDGDLFAEVAGVALSAHTVPHSCDWLGVDVGLCVSEVSPPGKVITCRLGREVPGFTYSNEPSALIVDEGRVVDAIDVAEGIAALATIVAEVHVTHEHIGDLRLVLVAPGGQEVVLRERSGGSGHGIAERYDSAAHPGLAAFVGKPSHGRWMLRVEDHAAQDVGRLDRWQLTIG